MKPAPPNISIREILLVSECRSVICTGLDDYQSTTLPLPEFGNHECHVENAVKDNAGSRESLISFATTQFHDGF